MSPRLHPAPLSLRPLDRHALIEQKLAQLPVLTRRLLIRSQLLGFYPYITHMQHGDLKQDQLCFVKRHKPDVVRVRVRRGDVLDSLPEFELTAPDGVLQTDKKAKTFYLVGLEEPTHYMIHPF